MLTNNDVIRQLETNIEQSRNTEAAKAARTKLQNYEKSEWINGRITRDSLPALERKAGTDKRRVNELNDIKRLLDKADGGN